MREDTKTASGLLCPLGGDETNDCAGCVYSGDYHFVDGECVRRSDDDETETQN